MIIGLTGKNCAGKGEVANIFKKKNFDYFSLSDAIREEAESRKIAKTRENLIKLGNELRRVHGPSVLARRIARKIIKDTVIDSIRNPEEIKELKKNKDFILVGIDAPIKLRFERAKKRNRESEAQNLKEFVRREELENKSERNNQQLNKCLSMANMIIINDKTKKELEEKINKVLEDVDHKPSKKTERPIWEEYFMNITKEISKRSTCMSTQFGAIIVKDERIISTGYNGAPRKTLDCYERGFCLRRKMGIPSGHRYELCRSVHAEQNAIINAARAGVSLKDAELYMYAIKVYQEENKLIDAIPCFICKKMIINAGIKKVHSITKEGTIKSFDVQKDWADQWQKKDMLDDMDVYDSDYYKNK